MSSFKSYRNESRGNWGTQAEKLNVEQIQLGALLRIADATESMATNHVRLIEERDRLSRLYKESQARLERERRTNSALRGVITKMRKAKS